MSEKRLSETMSDTIDIIGEAQETLDNAITEAINTHFEAGIQIEQERIIRLLQDESFINGLGDRAINEKLEVLIALIKGEQK
jgi:hypothetical protein